jgi:DNA-binding NarL/FixJ family response regulator
MLCVGRSKEGMAKPGTMGKIRVLIVDDLDHVRQGLRTVLELTDDLEVAGEAGTGLEAIQQTDQLEPDVVLMDIEMPELDGLEATRRIKSRHPNTGVVMLTIYDDPANREQAANAGVDAVYKKGAPLDQVLAAIHRFARISDP